MSESEKLDKILRYLLTDINHAQRPEHILEKAGLKESKEVSTMMLNFLSKEGFVFRRNGFYGINYTGVVFIKYQNGYVGRHETQANQKKIQNLKDCLLILGTWVASIAALLLLAWQIYEHFADHH